MYFGLSCCSPEPRGHRRRVGAAGVCASHACDRREPRLGRRRQETSAGFCPATPQPYQAATCGGARGPGPSDNRGAAPHQIADTPGAQEAGLRRPFTAPEARLALPAQPVQNAHRQAFPPEGAQPQGGARERTQLLRWRGLRHASGSASSDRLQFSP